MDWSQRNIKWRLSYLIVQHPNERIDTYIM